MTTAVRPYYKRYHSDWLSGTTQLNVEEKGALVSLVDLLFKYGGKIKNDPVWLARQAGCSIRKWKVLLSSLMEQGYAYLGQDGSIASDRVDEQLERDAKDARDFVENGAKGGRKKAENLRLSNDINDLNKIRLGENPSILSSSPYSSLDSDSIEQNRTVQDSGSGAISTEQCHVLFPPDDQSASHDHQPEPALDPIASDFDRPAPAAENPPPPPPQRQLTDQEKMPRASDPVHLWIGSGLTNDKDGKPQSQLDEDGKQLALAGPRHNRTIIDRAAQSICDAALISHSWRGDWWTLTGWLNDGIPIREIVDAIKAVAAQPNYKQPKTLRYFDRPVRNAFALKRRDAA